MMAAEVLVVIFTLIISQSFAMQPNLLLIGMLVHQKQKFSVSFLIAHNTSVADDLGYGDLSAYGHPTTQDPYLSQLATESLVMTDFYAASPVCSPSRASMLTGLYPTSTGMWPGGNVTNTVCSSCSSED